MVYSRPDNSNSHHIGSAVGHTVLSAWLPQRWLLPLTLLGTPVLYSVKAYGAARELKRKNFFGTGEKRRRKKPFFYYGSKAQIYFRNDQRHFFKEDIPWHI